MLKRIIALAAIGSLCGGGAAAQTQAGARSQSGPAASFARVPEDPGTALSRNLTAIAADPRNVAALAGAGKAAIALGDPQSALSFYVRAEEIAPRDGRIKAGIGSALVMVEQPQTALTFFDNALALGVPEAEFAGDRGFAFDLLGNPRRA